MEVCGDCVKGCGDCVEVYMGRLRGSVWRFCGSIVFLVNQGWTQSSCARPT